MPLAQIGLNWLEKVLGKLQSGSLTLRFPDGKVRTFRGEQPGVAAELDILRPRFFSRVLMGGDVGFAEAYMDGDCDSPNMTALIRLVLDNSGRLNRHLYASTIIRLANRLLHLARPNNISGARRNIAAHYDLGNEFYRAWLDETMTYSAAVFERPDMPIHEAQESKYRRIADLAEINSAHHVLEIGCGWGGFAEFAARERGAKVTALTISDAQFNYAKKRIFEAGLNERVQVRKDDYRNVEGTFDRIASIEMFEAVGEKYWPDYFTTLRERLVPGGRAGLQIITIADHAFDAYRRGTDFIQKYIFPGGMLPSPQVLLKEVEKAGLRLETSVGYANHYARTLAEWHVRFEEAWPGLNKMGFDERFRRMWKYYFAYCEAGFDHGHIDVRQIGLQKI